MYLLDTNIVSLLDPRRRGFALPLLEWIRRSGNALFLSAMTIAELEAGALKLRRRQQDKRADEIDTLIEEIETYFGDRVLPMDRHMSLASSRASKTR